MEIMCHNEADNGNFSHQRKSGTSVSHIHFSHYSNFEERNTFSGTILTKWCQLKLFILQIDSA